jgi:hypothetical protein
MVHDIIHHVKRILLEIFTIILIGYEFNNELTLHIENLQNIVVSYS